MDRVLAGCLLLATSSLRTLPIGLASGCSSPHQQVFTCMHSPLRLVCAPLNDAARQAAQPVDGVGAQLVVIEVCKEQAGGAPLSGANDQDHWAGRCVGGWVRWVRWVVIGGGMQRSTESVAGAGAAQDDEPGGWPGAAGPPQLLGE